MPDPKASLLWTDQQYKDVLLGRCTVETNGCWTINGFKWFSRAWKGGSGYGAMSYRGKAWRSHRLAYFLWKGPIPAGHVVRHTCDNQSCCNPDHLVSGTQKENIADCIARGRQQFHPSHHTHCKRGHPYEQHGRKFQGLSGIWRACRVCQLAIVRRRAGWPESHWWIPAQPKGQRPSFTSKIKGVE